MNRKYTDGAAAFIVGTVLLLGGLATWQSYQQWAALGEMGDHMGMSVTAMHGTHPVWYLLGTILVASVISGMYIGFRDRIISSADHAGATGSSENDPDTDKQPEDHAVEASSNNAKGSVRPILDLLPDDERRVLQPVITSPGLTQIELRDRSDFSKSKVSQTVTELEKRGLLYREPQGRTYRVYPSEELGQNEGQHTFIE